MADIRIYVADLAAYNSGKLHGAWIDATIELDEIHYQIQSMLKESPESAAEEFAIHDYEGFGVCGLSEYESIESVREKACFIQSADAEELVGELLNYFGGNVGDAKKALEENYNGCHESLADYAQELTEETSEIPRHLVAYIDYERMGRDMELSGDVFSIEAAHNEVHVFWNH